MDATTVVSLIGDAWSPNIPPERAAPNINEVERSNVDAIDIAIGIIIANVPQLDPTEKAIKPDTKNTRGAVSYTHLTLPTKA